MIQLKLPTGNSEYQKYRIFVWVLNSLIREHKPQTDEDIIRLIKPKVLNEIDELKPTTEEAGIRLATCKRRTYTKAILKDLIKVCDRITIDEIQVA